MTSRVAPFRGRLFVRSAAAAVALVLVTAGCTTRASSKPSSVRIFPSPGSKVASPSTQISVRGGSPEDIGSLTVAGSTSGSHPGRVQAHSDGRGVSFIPDAAFEPGETVTVTSKIAIAGVAGGIGGGTGAGTGTFTIATPAEQKWEPMPTVRADWQTGALTLKSRPDLRPSSLTITTPASRTAAGLLMLTMQGGPSGSGPEIIDDAGRLVWYEPLPDKTSAADLRVQTMGGKPVLTWWKGSLATGMGRGHYIVMDQTYTEIATVKAGNGYTADLHDMRLMPDGTAWIMIYTPVKWDLSPAGGQADGFAFDNVVQQIDVATGSVLFEWHSLDHVGLDESFRPLPETPEAGWDYFHVNSLDVERGGTLLLSARNTSTLYRIDAATGAVRWRLGGKKSDFMVAENAAFGWQHDARLLPDGTISLFDNAAATEEEKSKVSAALRLKLDEEAKTATLVSRLEHSSKLLAASRGSVLRFENGNTFVGWGSKPNMSEYDADGNVVFDARMDPGVSYRTHRTPWTGRPAAEPAVVVSSGAGGVSVAVSWNGDTQTTTWELLAGESATALERVAAVPRAGFETELTGPAAVAFVAVRALDANGTVLATSQARVVGA